MVLLALSTFGLISFNLLRPDLVLAKTRTASPSASATASATPVISVSTPEPPRVDITQKSVETSGPLEKLLKDQKLGECLAV